MGNNILFRGVKDGRRFKVQIKYEPTMYVPSRKITNFTTLNGDYLEPFKAGGIRDTRDFIKKYEDVEGFKIYGQNRFEYAFIADQHPDTVEWDQEKVSIAIIDIEVGSENGFPDPYQANEPITAIAIKKLGSANTFVFGCGDFKSQEIGRAHV